MSMHGQLPRPSSSSAQRFALCNGEERWTPHLPLRGLRLTAATSPLSPLPSPADVEVSKLGCDPQASTVSSLPIVICFALPWRSAMGREGARCVERRRHLVDGSRPAVCPSARCRMAFLQRRNSLMFGRGTQSVCGKVRKCGGEGRITLIHMCIRRMNCRMARQGEREEGSGKTYPDAYGVRLARRC
jgi:hypothetical protein